MKDFTTMIVDAIHNVVTNRLSQLNYIYHVKAKIKSEEENGHYLAEYRGQFITITNPNNVSVSIGDVVDVLYSNTDPNYRVIHFKY